LYEKPITDMYLVNEKVRRVFSIEGMQNNFRVGLYSGDFFVYFLCGRQKVKKLI